MKIILQPSGNIMKILGKAKPAEYGLRWMYYVVTQPVDGGVLVFHTLTRAMFLLTTEEYTAPDALPELRDGWFRVPQEMDDQKYADHVRFLRKTMYKKSKHITNYVIFTTTDCNARCFYCYELGRSRIPMSVETAHKAADYISAHCGGENVSIQWFGGEPLFNKNILDIISSDLATKGVEYTSIMISNGYLFDDATVKQAVKLWKLKCIQISMDGTELVYNRSKAYIYKDGESPYRIVLANIRRLLDAGIHVTIRLNMDQYNADDLPVLVDELHTMFPDRKNLSVYSHTLFEFMGSIGHIRQEEARHELYQKQKIIRRKMFSYGMTQKRNLANTSPVQHCMADSGSSLTILPNGELGLCEHFSEDHFVGHIDSDEFNQQIIEQFQKTKKPIKECKSCFCYPDCIRLEICSEQTNCYKESREIERQKIQESMQYTYFAWMKNEEADEEEINPVC